jgi:hypothetical protein
MKRLSISILSALFILFLFFSGFMLGAYISRQLHGPDWIASFFFLLLSWPLWIFEPIFGTHQSLLSDHEPNLPALVATLITQLGIYSLMTYSALWWRAKRKHF